MTLDYFLIDHLDEQVFGLSSYYFWVRTVIDAMAWLGPDTDADLERLSSLLLAYHSGADTYAEAVSNIQREIVRLKGMAIFSDKTPIGLKYRCINAMQGSNEEHLHSSDWDYGVVTAFQLINYDHAKDQALIALIRENASKYEVDLHEQNKDEVPYG